MDSNKKKYDERMGFVKLGFDFVPEVYYACTGAIIEQFNISNRQLTEL